MKTFKHNFKINFHQNKLYSKLILLAFIQTYTLNPLPICEFLDPFLHGILITIMVNHKKDYG